MIDKQLVIHQSQTGAAGSIYRNNSATYHSTPLVKNK